MCRLTLTIDCTLIIPQTAPAVKGILAIAFRRPDAPFDFPEHRRGDFMGRLPDGHLRSPVGEEVDVPQQPFGVGILRQWQVQSRRGDDIGAVRREGGEGALRRLLVHVGHGAVRAGVVEIVLVFPGDFGGGLHDGAVEGEAGVALIRFYGPTTGERLVHHVALVQLPDRGQTAGLGVDVRDVEHADGPAGIVGVDGMDGLAAPANPEAAAVPLPHGGAGHGVRPLGGNQQGVFEGVFVEWSHRLQQLHPVFRGLGRFIQRNHRAFVKLGGLNSQMVSTSGLS